MPRTPFTIRSATPADDSAWARLRQALWPDCTADRHAEERALYLRSPGIVGLAVDAEKHAFGFAEVTIRRDHVAGTSQMPVPYLEGWYVDPAWRNQGVGRALIDFVSAWAHGAGYRELASDAELANVASQAAHTRLGFREVERTVIYLRSLDA